MFALQNAPEGEIRLPGLTLSPLDAESGVAKFDLTLDMEETEGRLIGSLEYNTDLFDRGTIERMIGHFRILFVWVLWCLACGTRHLSNGWLVL